MGLEFLHPHIETIINDNSFTFEEAVNSSSVMFQPYVSDMGECGTILQYTSLNDFIKKNGTPNYRKHGQSIYNIVNWLRAGGVAYTYRVTADDATYSNLAINVKAKIEEITSEPDEDGQTTTTKRLSVKPILDHSDVSHRSLLDLMLENKDKYPATPDAEGYSNYPIFSFYIKGKGSYGNDFNIELRPNYSQQSKYEFRTYSITIKRKDERGILRTIEGPFIVSLHPDSSDYSGNSLFIKDIIENYSKYISVGFNQDAYYTLMGLVDSAKEGTPEQSLISKEIDYLFWYSLNKDEKGIYQPYSFADCQTQDFGLDTLNGVALRGGSEGEFAMGKPDRFTKIYNKIGDVFDGREVPEITNKKLYPFEVVLDANYPREVKQKINELNNNRQDFVAFLDLGNEGAISVERAVTEKQAYLNFNNRFVSFFPQTLSVYDSYTTADITVTTPYFLASMIPNHDNKYGVQFPMAGPSRGIVSGFKPNSLSFNPDTNQQETLYRERLNYIIQDPDGTEIGTNLTSQSQTSALSSINNIRVLIKIIKQIEKRARHYRHEFSDDMTLSNFGADLKIIESEWTNNRACSQLTIQPYQDSYDKLQKTCRVAVSVVFNGTIERIIIEVNVEN